MKPSTHSRRYLAKCVNYWERALEVAYANEDDEATIRTIEEGRQKAHNLFSESALLSKSVRA